MKNASVILKPWVYELYRRLRYGAYTRSDRLYS